jgi:hypothetical protein
MCPRIRMLLPFVMVLVLLLAGVPGTQAAGPAPVLKPLGQIGGATYAVAAQGNLAAMGEGPRLLLLNSSNPSAPVLSGELAMPAWSKAWTSRANTPMWVWARMACTL